MSKLVVRGLPGAILSGFSLTLGNAHIDLTQEGREVGPLSGPVGDDGLVEAFTLQDRSANISHGHNSVIGMESPHSLTTAVGCTVAGGPGYTPGSLTTGSYQQFMGYTPPPESGNNSNE